MSKKLGAFFGFVIAVLAGLVFFFRNKAAKSELDAILGQVRGEDKGLVQKQTENQVKLDQINEDISALKEEKRKMRDQYLSAQERADKWNK
jgi:septal ring factor EnvC (AmiA/AmiB activator)